VSKLAALSVALILETAGCSPSPQNSGTKTNWLQDCDTTADCGEEGSCLCGLCTRPCDEGDSCAGGRCASFLASAAQCQQAGEAPGKDARLCLPALASDTGCSVFAVDTDFDLGAAVQPVCGVAGALICESFDQPLPTQSSTWIEGGMSVSLQDCLVNRGTGALHYTGSGDSFSQTRFRLPEPVTSGSLHARLLVRVPAEVTLPEQLQLFELWNGDDGSVERAALFVSPAGLPSIYVGASNVTLDAAPQYVLPRDAWVCLEVAFSLADADGIATLDMNGERVAERAAIDTLSTGGFSVAVVETLLKAATHDVDVYIDDLIVSTEPIGCP